VTVFLDWLSHGILDLSVTGVVIYALAVTHITIISVTVYLHRHAAHRAVELHPLLQHFFRFWVWLTTGMITKEWAAIHRKHHAMCETEGDPHSPRVMGLKKILLEGADIYRTATHDTEIMDRFGAGCPDDWMERNVYQRFTFLGIGSMLVLNVSLLGVLGLTVWAVQMMWVPIFAAGIINGIGHYWGYRNYECSDAATNILPWGILIGGEELHNNHHTYPNSAKLSQKPWEFDLGWFWIRTFEICGLAKARSTGPMVQKIQGKSTLDMDTAWAVLNDRFRVMAKYAEDVVAPLAEQEYHRADEATRKLFKKAKKTLCRDDSLVDEADRNRIAELTGYSPDLKVIYEFRLQLLDVWSKRGASADELLGALKQWCVDAENSGIQALSEFVEELKSYSIPQLSRA
jgi:stearoyl-CoA desaturase (delta-9 desaturase)